MAEDVTIELLEQMAALMDGQLVGPERSAFLARIAESEELYQLLLEATELREALDEESGAPPEAGGPTPFGLTVAGPGEAGETRGEPDAAPDSGAPTPFPPPEARGSEGPPGGWAQVATEPDVQSVGPEAVWSPENSPGGPPIVRADGVPLAPGVGGPPRLRSRARWLYPALAVAALLATLVPFLPSTFRPGGTEAPVPPPGLTATFMQGQRGWTTGRGGEERLLASERAIRIGALWMAVRLDLGAGGDGSGSAVADLATLLEFESGGGVLQAALGGALGTQDPGERQERTEAVHDLLSSALPAPAFAVGYRLEQLRAACISRSDRYLDDARLAQAVEEFTEEGPIGAALEPLVPLLRGAPRDWPALCSTADDILERLGG
jgi:hypothetical protein